MFYMYYPIVATLISSRIKLTSAYPSCVFYSKDEYMRRFIAMYSGIHIATKGFNRAERLMECDDVVA